MAHSSATVGSIPATVDQCNEVINSLVPEADARWSPLMKGIIYPDPPSKDAIQDPTLELSIEDLQDKIDRGEFENLSMIIEHDENATLNTRVGRIVRASVNPANRNVEIEFRLREDGAGSGVSDLVRSGKLSELSLGHVYMNETGKSRALEVSLVAKGARKGCKIIRASARFASTGATAAAAAAAAAAAPPVAPASAPVVPAEAATAAPMEGVAPTATGASPGAPVPGPSAANVAGANSAAPVHAATPPHAGMYAPPRRAHLPVRVTHPVAFHPQSPSPYPSPRPSLSPWTPRPPPPPPPPPRPPHRRPLWPRLLPSLPLLPSPMQRRRRLSLCRCSSSN